MKRLLAAILCLLLLGGCVRTPAAEESPAPPSPPPEAEAFVFTEDNYPRVDGSTATIPLIEAVECALLGKKRAEVTVNVSKTSGAYIALANKEADILFVYDGGDETREAVKADEKFETIPIGKDALVFLVNKDNPIDDLTSGQVRKIFSGEYTNWSELGGSDEPIRAYQRGIGSGSQALMDKLVMDGTPMADPARVQVIESMGGLVDAVANFVGGPTGIGYNVYYYVTEMKENDYIKILSIDGVEPNYETIQSDEYPFVSEFYSVIRKEEPAGSAARALHEWILTDEAQNLMASENYVALHANPNADTPRVDGDYAMYPEGEAPVYFEGTNPYALEARDDYGPLYFYLGSIHHEMFSSPMFYGLCTAEGRIVTEPIYAVPELLTDSRGNQAYICFRSDLERDGEAVSREDWSDRSISNPAILFATDGSWVMEFDGADFCYGFSMASEFIMNADFIAVKKDGKWGAVNMNGETVIAFERSSPKGLYGLREIDYTDYGSNKLGITANRYLGNLEGADAGNLYNAGDKLIATGIKGMPMRGATTYFVTTEWSEERRAIYSYTLDGELLAKFEVPEGQMCGATQMDEYIQLSPDGKMIICDKYFNVIYEFLPVPADESGYTYTLYSDGPNILCRSNFKTLFHRTYLPDGTRLVTWYDPDMGEQEFEKGIEWYESRLSATDLN